MWIQPLTISRTERQFENYCISAAFLQTLGMVFVPNRWLLSRWSVAKNLLNYERKENMYGYLGFKK